MTSLPAVVAMALTSALAAAASSVLQHRSARQAPDSTGRNGLTLLRHLVGQPLWLLGLLSAAVGLALHVAALNGGRLALVQPLLVSGLLFALPVSALLHERRRPSVVQWAWAAVVMIGLSTFLLVARPHGGTGSTHPPRLLLVTIAGGASMAGLAAAARVDGQRRPVLLASAGGIGFGVASALMKQCTAAVGHGPAPVLASWALYGALFVGAAAITLTQVAYRSGPLASSLPAMTIGDPAAAVLIGVLAFHEQINAAPVAVATQVVAFALMGLGTGSLPGSPLPPSGDRPTASRVIRVVNDAHDPDTGCYALSEEASTQTRWIGGASSPASQHPALRRAEHGTYAHDASAAPADRGTGSASDTRRGFPRPISVGQVEAPIAIRVRRTSAAGPNRRRRRGPRSPRRPRCAQPGRAPSTAGPATVSAGPGGAPLCAVGDCSARTRRGTQRADRT